MLEEPYELIAHVRLCGEVDRVTGRLYPERCGLRSTEPQIVTKLSAEHGSQKFAPAVASAEADVM